MLPFNTDVSCPYCGNFFNRPPKEWTNRKVLCKKCNLKSFYDGDSLLKIEPPSLEKPESTPISENPDQQPVVKTEVKQELGFISWLLKRFRGVDAYFWYGFITFWMFLFSMFIWEVGAKGVWFQSLILLSLVSGLGFVIRSNSDYLQWARLFAVSWALYFLVLTPFFLYFSTYTVFWTKEVNGSTVFYFDSYTNFSGKMVHRRLTFTENGDDVRTEGPVSSSGSPHGEWSESRFSKAGYKSQKKYFWYGETVTEGEWHLRNR